MENTRKPLTAHDDCRPVGLGNLKQATLERYLGKEYHKLNSNRMEFIPLFILYLVYDQMVFLAWE